MQRQVIRKPNRLKRNARERQAPRGKVLNDALSALDARQGKLEPASATRVIGFSGSDGQSLSRRPLSARVPKTVTVSSALAAQFRWKVSAHAHKFGDLSVARPRIHKSKHAAVARNHDVVHLPAKSAPTAAISSDLALFPSIAEATPSTVPTMVDASAHQSRACFPVRRQFSNGVTPLDSAAASRSADELL